MKAIRITDLSKEHEGLRVGFDCPPEIGTDAGVPHAIMPDGSKRLLNTELEWTYHGRNDLENEPEAGLFRHVHNMYWIKIQLDNPIYTGRMIWIEESPTERLIENVASYLKSLENVQGTVTVRVESSTQGAMTFPRETP